jgi:tryptophan 2,3-dioxygenase
MKNAGFSKEELEKGIQYLEILKEKYEGIGQDFFDYLEGLVESTGLTYWHYIGLNSLLGLQAPRTNHPDEMIFIVYHQITELYFKLIKHELFQLSDPVAKRYEDLEAWYKHIDRAVNYLRQLCDSFSIMYKGMDPQQFRKFRMALLPASGFQSVQFRHIEIMSTRLRNLLQDQYRTTEAWPEGDPYEFLYWKQGGIEEESGHKTLTLRQFEAKYNDELRSWIRQYQFRNLLFLFQQLEEEKRQDPKLLQLLRQYDTHINVYWRLSHLSAASRYLKLDQDGTGGTNWRRYLPPKFQRIVFFDTIWDDTEKDEWGKAAVMRVFREQFQEKW